MKNKILFSILLLTAVVFTSCENVQRQQQTKVHCYKQYDSNANMWLWYYVLFMNNQPYYYYQSPTQVTNFSTIQWTTNNSGFNQTVAQEQPFEYVESSGFSEGMQQDFQQSNGFETESDYSESSGFSNDNSNSSSDNSGSSGSESGGFDGGSSGGDSGGGDSGGGESGGFDSN